MEKNNSAKFVFWYGLAFVSLIAGTVALGGVIFQIINKFIGEAGELYGSRYSLSVLRTAISALVVAAPIYFGATFKINKAMANGELAAESGVRRWLTYFILLIAAVVMMGYFIGVINTFLNGELTVKFGLKAVTALGIAGIVLGYYAYDLKRDTGRRDGVIKIFGAMGMVLVVAVFLAGVFLVESPFEARRRNQDGEIENQLNNLRYRLDKFYLNEGQLPGSLRKLMEEDEVLTEETIKNPVTGEEFEYKVLGGRSFEICTEFITNTDENEESRMNLSNYSWRHKKGRNCFKREATTESEKGLLMPAPPPVGI